MTKFWVFFLAEKYWKQSYGYVDASDWNEFAPYQWTIIKYQIRIVFDDTYEQLSRLSKKDLAKTLEFFTESDTAIHSN